MSLSGYPPGYYPEVVPKISVASGSPLVDWQIKLARHEGLLDITPWDESHIQPASYEMTLDSKFKRFHPDTVIIDPLDKVSTSMMDMEVKAGDCLILVPGAFVLGCSVEYWTFSPYMAGQVNGKSSLARKGLLVHITAGWMDPGFEGNCTLEIVNLAPIPIKLWPGMAIAQMLFHPVAGAFRPYGTRGNHYQASRGVKEGAPVRLADVR